MKQIENFEQLTLHLKDIKERAKVVVVCPYDNNTKYAVTRALDEGIADFILIGDNEQMTKGVNWNDYYQHVELVRELDCNIAAQMAVEMIRTGKADILMKGIINTDNLLKVILNKEHGLLPAGRVLTHMAVMDIPTYNKLLFVSDAAVIPRPTLEQRIAMIHYATDVCHSFGIVQPKISLIHCTEKVNEKFAHTLDYVQLVEMCRNGEFGNAIVDGPLDVRSSCENESCRIKGINSPVGGDADVLIFPNIESGNTFYKAVSFFAGAEMAGQLLGTVCPVVLPSRSDSGYTKYYSVAMACLTSKAKKQ
jgi:phosphotransacetylase